LIQRDLTSSGAFNAGGYSNQKLDELIARARSTIDLEEQKKLFGEAQQIIHANMPILPLWAADVFCGWRPGLRGFQPHPLGYVDYSNVTVDN